MAALLETPIPPKNPTKLKNLDVAIHFLIIPLQTSVSARHTSLVISMKVKRQQERHLNANRIRPTNPNPNPNHNDNDASILE